MASVWARAPGKGLTDYSPVLVPRCPREHSIACGSHPDITSPVWKAPVAPRGFTGGGVDAPASLGFPNSIHSLGSEFCLPFRLVPQSSKTKTWTRACFHREAPVWLLRARTISTGRLRTGPSTGHLCEDAKGIRRVGQRACRAAAKAGAAAVSSSAWQRLCSEPKPSTEGQAPAVRHSRTQPFHGGW